MVADIRRCRANDQWHAVGIDEQSVLRSPFVLRPTGFSVGRNAASSLENSSGMRACAKSCFVSASQPEQNTLERD